MISFDDISAENMKENNLKWPQISYHLQIILITDSFGTGKTNALLDLINHETDIDKIYLYAKDPYKAKYHLSINKH